MDGFQRLKEEDERDRQHFIELNRRHRAAQDDLSWRDHVEILRKNALKEAIEQQRREDRQKELEVMEIKGRFLYACCLFLLLFAVILVVFIVAYLFFMVAGAGWNVSNM